MISIAIAHFIASGGSEFAPGVSSTSSLALIVPLAVAIVASVPGTIAAIRVEKVRHEVTSSVGGGSSYDVLHRLVWETHEKANDVLAIAETNAERIARLEAEAEISPKEDS